jgi:hypothetical protein
MNDNIENREKNEHTDYNSESAGSINPKLLDKVVNFKYHFRMKMGIILISISAMMLLLTLAGAYQSNPSLMYKVFGFGGIFGVLTILFNFFRIKKAKNYTEIFRVDEAGLRKIHANLAAPVYEKAPLILTNNYIFFLSNSCKRLFINYDEIAAIKYAKADVGGGGILHFLLMPKILSFVNNQGKVIAKVEVKEKNMGEVKEKLLGINSRLEVEG